MRNLLLRFRQAACDRLAHVAEPDRLVRNTVGERPRPAAAGGLGRRGHRRRGPRDLRGLRPASGRTQVGADNPPSGAAPSQFRQVDPCASASRRASGDALTRSPLSTLWAAAGAGGAAGVSPPPVAGGAASTFASSFFGGGAASAFGAAQPRILLPPRPPKSRLAFRPSPRPSLPGPGSWRSCPRRPLRTPSSPCRSRSRPGCRPTTPCHLP